MPISTDYLTQLFGLEGDVALITGGAGAVGVTTARAYAAAGAAVVMADKVLEPAERTADEIRRAGGRAIALAMDVTKEDAVDQGVASVERELGPIDILVNNAAINIRKPPHELTLADWTSVIEVNLTGYFLCARTVGRGMLARRSGRIINVASIMSYRGSSITPNLVYATSKGGVATFTRALAGEWAPHGIRVNGVAPTYLRTPLTEKLLSDPQVSAKIAARTPMGKVGVPEDLVGAMLFLAARASSLVTGHTIAIDAGWLAW